MIKTFQVTQIGTHHTNHCEDYTIIEKAGEDKILCAVMDGCTMGTDSHLIAGLTGKILRKIAIEKNYEELYQNEPTTPDEDLKEVLRQLFIHLKQLKNNLLLKDNELLTTLILMIVDTYHEDGAVITIGDGLVCINGEMTEYEQENRPDYLGYHLGEDFEEWYEKQTQIICFEDIKDISISTDGIFTFSKINKGKYPNRKDPVHYLLTENSFEEQDNMLAKKLLLLERESGIAPTDDLGMIRLINNP